MNTNSPSQFAYFGAAPAFQRPLHVNKPYVADRSQFQKLVSDALDRGWLTNDGPLVQELEERLADYLGVRECVLTANATIGLELVLQAMEIKGEILLPSFTFISTAHTLKKLGLKPVFCDIDPHDHNLSVDACRENASGQVGGIIPTHIWGQPAAVEPFTELAAELDCPLIFDAAHAFDTRHTDKWVGQFGKAEVFSLHATKYFQAVEGGAITTNDTALAQQLRLARNFGFRDFDQVDRLGTNAKMSELHAAMGLSNFEHLADIRRRSHAVHQIYRDQLCDLDGVRFLDFTNNAHDNRQYCVMEIDEDVLGLSRDQLLDLLAAENVLARRYFYPGAHRLAPHQSGASVSLPVTDAVARRILILPSGASVSADEAKKTAELIEKITTHAEELSTAFKQQARPDGPAQ